MILQRYIRLWGIDRVNVLTLSKLGESRAKERGHSLKVRGATFSQGGLWVYGTGGQRR